MLALASPFDTPYHRWPAWLKYALLSVVTLGLFLSDTVAVQLVALAAVGGLYAAAGGAFLRAGIRSLRPLWPFLLLVGVWYGATGDPRAGMVVCLRLLAAVALANLVTMTTQLGDAIDVAMWLLAPLRHLGVPTGQIAFAIALVIRFVPVTLANARRLMEAWRARSPRRPGWQVIAPIFLVALDDATRVAEAIRARADLSTYSDEQES